MQKEGGEVDKQSAWGRDNAVKTIIFFQMFKPSILTNSQMLSFQKPPQSSHPEQKKSFHLGPQWLLVSVSRLMICFSEVLLILPPHVKTFILTACVPSPHHQRILTSPSHFLLLQLSQWGKLTEEVEHKHSQAAVYLVMIKKIIQFPCLF